ncbi:MAG TPA: hypothetical protein DCR40_18155 [Prolixibacteraceae bacterium]|nr:hypothetical protein [Prolixibacteraceae bacterium]
MLKFSFIDEGLKDFIRDDEGEVLVKEFTTWTDADEFIMDGGLEEYGWTDQGTRKHCWNDPDGD